MGLRQNEEALGKGNCYQISADCARISTAGGKSVSVPAADGSVNQTPHAVPLHFIRSSK